MRHCGLYFSDEADGGKKKQVANRGDLAAFGEGWSRKVEEGEGGQGTAPKDQGSWVVVVGITASGLHARRFEMGLLSQLGIQCFSLGVWAGDASI